MPISRNAIWPQLMPSNNESTIIMVYDLLLPRNLLHICVHIRKRLTLTLATYSQATMWGLAFVQEIPFSCHNLVLLKFKHHRVICFRKIILAHHFWCKHKHHPSQVVSNLFGSVAVIFVNQPKDYCRISTIKVYLHNNIRRCFNIHAEPSKKPLGIKFVKVACVPLREEDLQPI